MTVSISHVLVPVDQSPPSNRAAAVGLHIARTSGAELTFLHLHIREAAIQETITIKPEDLDEISDAKLESILVELVGDASEESLRSKAEHSIVEFERSGHSPAEVTINYSKSHKVDFIVVGAHVHSKVHDILMGNVTEGILRHADCPVAVVR